MVLFKPLIFGVIVLAFFYNFAKTQNIVDPSIYTRNPCGWYNASNYTTFKHIKTGYLLSQDGVASYRFTKKNVFQIMQYYNYAVQGAYEQPIVDGHALYTKPWYNNTGGLYAMDIEGGCNLNRRVQAWSSNELAKNRLFQIYPDGTIGTVCWKAEDWRLVLDRNKQQVMKKMSDVKPEDMKWDINNLVSVEYVPNS